MNTSAKPGFTNISVITRISHVVLAKVLLMAVAIFAVNNGAASGDGWFVLAMIPSMYFMVAGLTGWDPVIALVDLIKRNLKDIHFSNNIALHH